MNGDTCWFGLKLPFDFKEYRQRWNALELEMSRLGYETAVIWGRSGGTFDRAGSITYLCNYASHASGQEEFPIGSSYAAMVFHIGNSPELHISEPKSTVDLQYVATDNICEHLDDLGMGVGQRVREITEDKKVAFLGENFLPVQLYKSLIDASPNIEWRAEDHLLDEIMINKSEAELDVFRDAGRVASLALDRFIGALRHGERHCDAAALAAWTVISNGGGFHRVCCHSGPQSEHSIWDNPLYSYSERRPQEGDMVRAWVYGPIQRGYWVDPGRSAICGTPSSTQKKLIEDGVEVTEYLISKIKQGVTPREVGISGDDYVQKLGYRLDRGAAIWDIYGHGLSHFWHGPDIPANGAKNVASGLGFKNYDRPFKAGEVFTVETFLHSEGVGTSSFEEVFIIWENGVERLTSDVPMLYW